jgi:hypothetical protein
MTTSLQGTNARRAGSLRSFRQTGKEAKIDEELVD